MANKRLIDIARQLDLSIATVSRALNSTTEHMVKEETRKRILDLVKKTGFKPNIRARELVKGKETTFTLLLPIGVDSVFYTEYYFKLIDGINNVITGTEYTLEILPVVKEYTEEEIYKIILNCNTAGLILSPYCKAIHIPFDIIKRYPFPIITIDSELKGRNAYNVVLDHQKAGYKGIEYLAQRGYENIAVISDSGHSPHSEMRKEGIRQYLKEKKIAEGAVTHMEYPFSRTSGLPALKEIIGLKKRSIGVFSFNDEIAVGILNNMAQMGLRCPADIAILGFDGLPIGQYTIPRLSSVAFPLKKIGEIVARGLIELASKGKTKRRTVIQADILEWESC
ncbi:LacI family DNA-binding transcriptional regulator [Candidatus Omnitrophota bacterium]